MHRYYKHIFFILMVTLLCVGGCAAPQTDTATTEDPQAEEQETVIEAKRTVYDVQWTAVELGGEQIVLKEGQRAPYFILSQEDSKVSGFSGCNRLAGTFYAKNNIFLFNKLISTRMACRHGVHLENQFLKALDQTEAYTIEGDSLLLKDVEGNILVQLISNE